MNELKCKKSELIGLLIRIIPTGYPGLNRFMNQLSLKIRTTRSRTDS